MAQPPYQMRVSWRVKETPSPGTTGLSAVIEMQAHVISVFVQVHKYEDTIFLYDRGVVENMNKISASEAMQVSASV